MKKSKLPRATIIKSSFIYYNAEDSIILCYPKINVSLSYKDSFVN